MKNLNIDVARRHVQEIGETCPSSGTPLSLNTPDILNSLISIANPFFDTPPCNGPVDGSMSNPLTDQLNNEANNNGDLDGTQDKKVFATLESAPKPKMSVPSLTTQFIKEGLKLTIQKKRKNCGKEELDVKSELAPSHKMRKKEEVDYYSYYSNHSDASSKVYSLLFNCVVCFTILVWICFAFFLSLAILSSVVSEQRLFDSSGKTYLLSPLTLECN